MEVCGSMPLQSSNVLLWQGNLFPLDIHFTSIYFEETELGRCCICFYGMLENVFSGNRFSWRVRGSDWISRSVIILLFWETYLTTRCLTALITNFITYIDYTFIFFHYTFGVRYKYFSLILREESEISAS